MIVSEKQQQANRRNAQQSTGPKTPEGKAVVRLNALTYGLRARSAIITGEDPEQYKQLWDALVAEWQPQTCTERLFLEQMATAQWLLARTATGANSVFEADIPAERQFALLREVNQQRASLERSFTSGLRELKQLQKERHAKCAQPAQARPTQPGKPTKPATPPPAPVPDYVMSDAVGQASQPVQANR